MSVRTAFLGVLLLAAFGAQAVDRHRVWHQGREIDVVDIGGWAVYDGDILIGRTAEVLERSLREGPDGARIGSLAKSLTIGISEGRWPRGSSGLFELPYVIEDDPDGNVPNAVTLFNSSLAGLMRAVPRTTEADYVAFTLSATDDGGACSATIGRVGGRQLIQGSHLCSGGVLVHEMGHAIGLFHEQNHGDYPRYLQLDVNRVDPARAFNYTPSVFQRDATAYDFGSVMHYASTSFSRDGTSVMETIPPGIPLGQRNGYSEADVDGIRRRYGSPPQAITVTTSPAGLRVIVDGVAITAPATFNWSIGSTHTLDAPAAPQLLDGTPHVFARWNVDRTADLAARRTITVAAGDGSLTAPATAPAVTTYTANFVRYKEVRLTTSGNRAGVGGSVTASPAPAALPGLTGTFYRERQDFSLDPLPDAGSNFASWNGAYFFFGSYTTQYRAPFRGPVAFSDTLLTAYEYRAFFVDFPLLKVRAQSQAGEALGLRAAVTRGTAAATNERLPYAAVAWPPGQSGTLSMAATQTPFVTTQRYVFRDWDGDPTPAINVTSPPLGQPSRTVTANVNKQYQAFKQVIPTCAGSITVGGGDGSGWYDHGSSIGVDLTMIPGWSLTRWEGSLSGTAPSATVAVNDFPNLVARLNVTSAPLAVTAVAPATVAPGSPVTLDITGTGFTASTEVYVNGGRVSSQFVSATRLTATATSDALPTSGLAIVTVTNRVAAGEACSVSASGSADVRSAATSANLPGALTGLWWNASESGWGLHFTQRGSNVFAAWYTYNGSGAPKWYTSICGGISGTTGTCSGAIFEVSGPQFFGVPFNSSAVTTRQNGTMQLTFTGVDTGSMSYSGVSGQSRTVPITRTPLSASGTPPAVNYTDIWWAQGESGWGIAVTQQFSIVFLAWYVYDAAGQPTWYSAICTLSGTSCTGDVLRTTGPAFGPSFDTSQVHSTNAGTIAVNFTDANNATMSYTVNGVSGNKTITRFVF